MRSKNLAEGWRSSTSTMLGLYSMLLALWGLMLVAILAWKVSSYMDELATQTLELRARLFEGIPLEHLQHSLKEHYQLDSRSLNHYGLFGAAGQHLSGRIIRSPIDLPVDGTVHRTRCAACLDGDASTAKIHAMAIRLADGRVLVLSRDSRNSSLTDVLRIIQSALTWGCLSMVVPGLIGWHYLRLRPLRRIEKIDLIYRAIIRGDLSRRLPVSPRPDELDVLSGITNVMLDRVERLMNDTKNVSDNIAHDLRTPLTRMRTGVQRMLQRADTSATQSRELETILADLDSLVARFQALLRISELETHRRRAEFTDITPVLLLAELHAFYLPLAVEQNKTLFLQVPITQELPVIHADRALMFEAISNLLSNAFKYAPPGGQIILSASLHAGATRVEVGDSGPGIPAAERDKVTHRFFRGSSGAFSGGYGLGLSIVSAIVELHDFELQVKDSPLGGARVGIVCKSRPLH